jgi:hypothetical protein
MFTVSVTVATLVEQPCVSFSKVAGIAAMYKSACANPANPRAFKPAPSDGNSR